MNDSAHESPMKMTLRVAPDLRRALERWAKDNLSTMTAEINASIRLRMNLERQQGKVG